MDAANTYAAWRKSTCSTSTLPGQYALRSGLISASLNQSDRDILRSAGSKVSTHAKVGSLLGLGFGIYCAYRLRNMRLAYFNAFRAMEKPVEVRFADGRTGEE